MIIEWHSTFAVFDYFPAVCSPATQNGFDQSIDASSQSKMVAYEGKGYEYPVRGIVEAIGPKPGTGQNVSWANEAG